MNTYDFDKTIYITDSSAQFYKYCIRHFPAAILRTAPKSIGKALLYVFGVIDTRELKQQLFSFLRYIEDIDATVLDFWREHRAGLEKWYLAQKKEDDVIISASPEFLLKPVCEELGVHLMGTIMDKRTGVIFGLNCHDTEKVNRFYAQYPQGVTEEFYSDSLSDSPMAAIAKKAFLVDHGKLRPWPQVHLEKYTNNQ